VRKELIDFSWCDVIFAGSKFTLFLQTHVILTGRRQRPDHNYTFNNE